MGVASSWVGGRHSAVGHRRGDRRGWLAVPDGLLGSRWLAILPRGNRSGNAGVLVASGVSHRNGRSGGLCSVACWRLRSLGGVGSHLLGGGVRALVCGRTIACSLLGLRCATVGQGAGGGAGGSVARVGTDSCRGLRLLRLVAIAGVGGSLGLGRLLGRLLVAHGRVVWRRNAEMNITHLLPCLGLVSTTLRCYGTKEVLLFYNVVPCIHSLEPT